ncbi:serine hydrolase domain-containing protein [Microbacterium sp. gxy059]|uniref:serine hydrolase domain-containing protein n=1 Tax=Microbacterium sp. gxy059 TaxID=2957199 RepID=UPI003D99878D
MALILTVIGGVMVIVNTTPSSDRTGSAVGVAASALEAQGGPDGVVASFQDGEITEVAAVGEHPHGADTPFFVGSVSKMFTTAVVTRLVDDDRLDLDAPVTEYLPWFRTRGEHGAITLRHLLTQTSGLPEGAGRVDLVTPEVSLEQRVRVLAEVETVSEPGAEFHYCTKNFAVLALIVEAVTGAPYAEVLTEEVIEPLTCRAPTPIRSRRAATSLRGISRCSERSCRHPRRSSPAPWRTATSSRPPPIWRASRT